jgi:hypothetical protein
MLSIALFFALATFLISRLVIFLLNIILTFLTNKYHYPIPYVISWIAGIAIFAYYIYLFITDPSILE